MHAPSRTLTSPPASRRAVWLRRARRSIAAALIMVGLAGLAWAARAPLLRGAADLWIVSDPLTPADVAVVLGGGLDVRPFAAAELYHKGLVKKVLVSQVTDGRAVAIGAAARPHRGQSPGSFEVGGPGRRDRNIRKFEQEYQGGSACASRMDLTTCLAGRDHSGRESSKRDVCAGLSATSLRVNPSVSRSLHLTRRSTCARIGGKTISGSSHSRMRSSNSSITD